MAPPEHWFRSQDGAVSLVAGWSPTSGRYHFPPQPVCPYAGTGDVTERLVGGRGRLFVWTSVTAAPPGYEGPVPYGLGVVQFDAYGLRVVGRLTEPDPDRLARGQAMALVAEELPGGMRVWAFAPAAGEPDRDEPSAPDVKGPEGRIEPAAGEPDRDEPSGKPPP